MSFLEGLSEATDSLTGFGNAVGGVVQQVNEFELPKITTEHKVGLSTSSVVLIVLGIWGAFKVFKR